MTCKRVLSDHVGSDSAPRRCNGPQVAKEIFITENGCVTDDVLADDGTVYDTDRIMFLRACLTQLQRATKVLRRSPIGSLIGKIWNGTVEGG